MFPCYYCLHFNKLHLPFIPCYYWLLYSSFKYCYWNIERTINSFFHFNSIQSEHSLSIFPFQSFLFTQLIQTRTLTAKCISSDHFVHPAHFHILPSNSKCEGGQYVELRNPKITRTPILPKNIELQKYT